MGVLNNCIYGKFSGQEPPNSVEEEQGDCIQTVMLMMMMMMMTMMMMMMRMRPCAVEMHISQEPFWYRNQQGTGQTRMTPR